MKKHYKIRTKQEQGNKMESKRNITIRPADRENRADFEALLQLKGGPDYCRCMAWRMTKDELKQNNSFCRKEFIKQRVFSNTPIGILGYSGNEAIAWYSIAPRDTHQRLGGNENLKNVWHVTCFCIKKEYRKQGLVKFLIKSIEI
jgi:hypothetical protein